MGDHLIPSPPGLPPLPTAQVARLETSDGYGLRAAFFSPPGEARGTIVLLQGRAEFIEKYAEIYSALLARGFAVATLDWRGQGGSDRMMKDPRKGHIEDFDDYGRDLDALLAAMQARALPRPWGLLAHSTGAAVALQRFALGPSPFLRAVLCAPLVEIGPLLRWRRGARAAARLLSLIGMAGFYVPSGGPEPTAEKPFANNPLTSDPELYAQGAARSRAAPELAIGDPTIGWVEAAFVAMAAFEDPEFGQNNRTPILMVLGGADTVTDPSAAARLAGRLRGASALTLPGARHEILFEQERHRRAFWAAFDAFMVLDPAGADQA